MFTADLPPITGPDVEYSLIAPILIITAAAVIGTVVEAVVPRTHRFGVQAAVAVLGVLVAIGDTIWVYQSLDEVKGGTHSGRGQISTEGALSIDGPGVVTWLLLLVFALLSFLLFAERRLEGGLSAFTGRAADA